MVALGARPQRSDSSLKREILISASPQESWVALLEDGHLAEVMFDRPDQGRLVGDIYLGKVEAVLPGIQAAFVDEPRKAVEQADGLVAEVIQHLARSFAEERSSLERQWAGGNSVSTEDLRVSLQRYRQFFQALLRD